jgi:hypothetical protein
MAPASTEPDEDMVSVSLIWLSARDDDQTGAVPLEVRIWPLVPAAVTPSALVPLP